MRRDHIFSNISAEVDYSSFSSDRMLQNLEHQISDSRTTYSVVSVLATRPKHSEESSRSSKVWGAFNCIYIRWFWNWFVSCLYHSNCNLSIWLVFPLFTIFGFALFQCLLVCLHRLNLGWPCQRLCRSYLVLKIYHQNSLIFLLSAVFRSDIHLFSLRVCSFEILLVFCKLFDCVLFLIKI